MRARFVFSVSLLLGLAAALPARAGAVEIAKNFAYGINGIVTAPADPVIQVVIPPEKLEDMPLFPVTGRILGLFGGTLQMIHRLAAGVYDIPFAPLAGAVEPPLFSPPPRWALLPGVETE